MGGPRGVAGQPRAVPREVCVEGLGFFESSVAAAEVRDAACHVLGRAAAANPASAYAGHEAKLTGLLAALDTSAQAAVKASQALAFIEQQQQQQLGPFMRWLQKWKAEAAGGGEGGAAAGAADEPRRSSRRRGRVEEAPGDAPLSGVRKRRG